jgi:aspartyl-tRNA(Asn)/glutamyl-tRNA(Gln) amidotransferase subunit A
MDLTSATLLELRDAIAGGTISSSDATRFYLDRIQEHNPALHVFDEVYADRALARAAEVDTGKRTGVLAGVPIAIKENLCTDFGNTTCGSRILKDYRSPFTATSVAKLEAAGAVILGKANMDEFAMGGSTEHSATGPTHNPWATDYVPGGSSGGSAAAVAASLCAGALGSDTGGSIRQPAAYCGIVGVRPTYGRVSRWGLVAFASSLDQIGPLAHTVDDAALLLQVISGADPLDSTCADQAVPDYLQELSQPIEKPRIGLAKQYLSDDNHPAVAEAVEKAVKIFQAQGATIVEVDLPHTQYGIPTYYIVGTAEASSNLARFDGVHYGHRSSEAEDLIDLVSRSRAEGFGDEVKRRIMLGTYVLSSGYYDAYYLRALKVRRLIRQDFDRAFADCDCILCPTTTGPAFEIGAKVQDPLALYLNDIYTVPSSLAGIPGVSIPAGFAINGTDNNVKLPVGLQLFGNMFQEAKLLRIAKLFEQSTDYHLQRPTL